MKEYYNNTKTKRLWYDRWVKVWTMQLLDLEGNQIGSASHCHNRSVAFYWLNN